MTNDISMNSSAAITAAGTFPPFCGRAGTASVKYDIIKLVNPVGMFFTDRN